jgi:squalene-hopene/tetraprenyl-beta-curcumene cyclase
MKTLHLILILVLATTVGAAELPSKADVSLLKEVARAEEHGLNWLLKQQEKDGSWRNHPAITALAVTSFLRCGGALTTEQQEAVDHGVKFILTCAKPTGAIFGGGENDKYPNYSTAICTMALLATGKSEYTDTIRKARAFLLGSQFDESEKIEPANASYGGIGYGSRQRPDLSNTAWALEALRLTESLDTKASDSPHVGSKLHWQEAIAFLQRCQNLPSNNDQPWAKNATDRDLGGFIYMPGLSFANEGQPIDEKTPLRSYGSMSYAGLKSYLYAELKKDDPRVVAAINWLKHNYTLDENPGLGAQGLYYYYHTLAKALTACGADTFTDATGTVHDWRYELMNKLVSLQKHEGLWQNENNRWWENDPVLVTSYSLLALEIVQQRRYP